MPQERSAIVLLSGGLDSATVLAIARSESYKVHALSFTYGQRHAFELKRAKQLAKRYAHKHSIISLQPALFQNTALVGKKYSVPQASHHPPKDIPITYVPARNILFLSYALALAESHSIRDIFIGANVVDYSGYPDCRPEFLKAFSNMAKLGTRSGVQGEPFRIHAPLLYLSKKEIIEKGVELAVDYGLTSSCYQPTKTGKPCQKCESCRLRAIGFAEAKMEDPLINRKMSPAL